MAIVQDNFSQYPQRAYEGQPASQQRPDVYSGVATDTIYFGRAVVRAEGRQKVAPFSKDSTAKQVVGISLRQGNAMSMSYPTVGPVSGGILAGYYKDNEVSVIRTGAVWALCVDGAKAGDTVSVINEGDDIGKLTHGKGIELNLAFWREDVKAGSIGIIELNKNMTTA